MSRISFSLGDKTRYITNSAPAGTALYAIRSTIRSCGPFYFSKNFAILNSNVYLLNSDGVVKGVFELNHNLGSFFAFNRNITFSGCTRFFNNRGGSRGGGLLGLQPPQTILSSPSHLYTRLTKAWHSSCHSMVSSRQAV